MDKKLVEFFENKDFEVVEKKTTTQVLKKHGFDVSEMERDMKQNWNLVFLVNKK